MEGGLDLSAWRGAGASLLWEGWGTYGRLTSYDKGRLANVIPCVSFSKYAEGCMRGLSSPPSKFAVKIDLGDARLDSDDLSAIRQATSLWVRGKAFSDAHVDVVAKFENLESLSLEYTSVSPKGIALLQKLSNLKSLHLLGEINDDHMEEVGHLKELKDLAIGVSKISNRGIKSLDSLDKLDSLAIGVCHSQDPLEHLSKNLMLKHLNIYSGTPRSDIAASRIAYWPSLETLILDGVQISQETCSAVSKLTKLRRVSFHRTPAAERFLEAAASLPHLEEVLANDTDLQGDALKHLAGSRTLRTLSLSRTKLTDAQLKELANVPNLRELWLDDCQISDATILALVPTLPDLELLSLRSTGVSNASLTQIMKCRKLTYLNVANSRVDEEGLRAAVPPVGLRSLIVSCKVEKESLMRLDECKSLSMLGVVKGTITKEAIQRLSSFKELNHLVLSGSSIPEDGLAAVGELKQIQTIDLDGANVSVKGLSHLAGHPTIRRLNLRNSSVGDEDIRNLQKGMPFCLIIK